MTDQELKTRRAKKSPDVAKRLRILANEANALAVRLENNPGEGIGLLYCSVYGAWDAADRLMRDYQNTTQEEA